MITEADQKRINGWNDRIDAETSLKLVLSPDPRSEGFKSFCMALSRQASHIKVSTRQKEFGPAFMEIGDRVMYQAIPEGKEMEPFLEALAFTVKPPARLSERMSKMVNQIHVPADLRLFIAPQCPHCPILVRSLLPILFFGASLKLTIIDGSLYTEMARMYDIRSVPTLILDDDFQWNGMVNMEELLTTISRRDMGNLSQTTLTNLLKDGKASMIAEMMVRHQKLPSAFLKLVAHEKWPLRLGAMVAFEEIIRISPAMAVRSIPLLLGVFPGADDQAKGDILYLLGLIGSPESEPFLESIKHGGYNDEIMESATEALENIRAGQ
jgi:hypothetical protein